jgi:hypothetical protein
MKENFKVGDKVICININGKNLDYYATQVLKRLIWKEGKIVRIEPNPQWISVEFQNDKIHILHEEELRKI